MILLPFHSFDLELDWNCTAKLCSLAMLLKLLEFFNSDSSAGLIVQAAFFSACFFCTLSPYSARYHFHLPYLFSRQMWQVFFKVQQQWKTSTREQYHVSNQEGVPSSWFQIGILIPSAG
ncbi:hypothetical protein ACFX2K_017131 [Malus domestica]